MARITRADLLTEVRRQYVAAAGVDPAWREALATLKDDLPPHPVDEAVAHWWSVLRNPASPLQSRKTALTKLLSVLDR